MRYIFKKSKTHTHIKSEDTQFISGSAPKYIIYLVHGYRGDFNMLIRAMASLSSFDNVLIARASIGYNGREGNIHDWVGSIEDHKQYLKQHNLNELPIVYIGHSLGGVLGLNLVSLEKIIQCFCIASPFDFSPIESSNLRKANNFLRNQFGVGNPSFIMKRDRMTPALPKNLTISKSDAEKIHLIYGKNDPYVSIDSMYQIAEKFSIPENRCFVERRLPYSTHNSILLSKKAKDWIMKNINDYVN